MRTALKRIGSKERHLFFGSFEKYGYKNNYYGYSQTVLLREIKDENNKYLCDHLWFNATKGFKNINLHKGDIVSFYGRIVPYLKGYKGLKDVGNPVELDYQITYPTKIKLIEKKNENHERKAIRKMVRYRYSHKF